MIISSIASATGLGALLWALAVIFLLVLNHRLATRIRRGSKAAMAFMTSDPHFVDNDERLTDVPFPDGEGV